MRLSPPGTSIHRSVVDQLLPGGGSSSATLATLTRVLQADGTVAVDPVLGLVVVVALPDLEGRAVAGVVAGVDAHTLGGADGAVVVEDPALVGLVVEGQGRAVPPANGLVLRRPMTQG